MSTRAQTLRLYPCQCGQHWYLRRTAVGTSWLLILDKLVVSIQTDVSEISLAMLCNSVSRMRTVGTNMLTLDKHCHPTYIRSDTDILCCCAVSFHATCDIWKLHCQRNLVLQLDFQDVTVKTLCGSCWEIWLEIQALHLRHECCLKLQSQQFCVYCTAFWQSRILEQ